MGVRRWLAFERRQNCGSRLCASTKHVARTDRAPQSREICPLKSPLAFARLRGVWERLFPPFPEDKWSTKSTGKSALLRQEQSLQLANPKRPVIRISDLAAEHLSTIGQITAKALAMLEALLGPSAMPRAAFASRRYGRIAEAAHCAVSTVGGAIKALEARQPHDVGQSAQARPRACADRLGADGWRWRVMRTANASSSATRVRPTGPILLNPKKQCRSEGAERRQEASGKTNPRQRTKTHANRPLLCYNANVVKRWKRLHVQIYHFSGPGRRRS
jgi:hypothetical protein